MNIVVDSPDNCNAETAWEDDLPWILLIPTKERNHDQNSILFQTNPQQSLPFYSRSHTASVESRSRSANRNYRLLKANCKYVTPTIEATIKYDTVVSMAELKKTESSLRRKLEYYAKSNNVQLKIHVAKEIERSNIVHYHLTIATDMTISQLKTTLEKSTTKLKCSLKHIAKIENLDAWLRYATKNIKGATPLLFKSGLYVRQCLAWGGFFAKPVSQLDKEFFADKEAAASQADHEAIDIPLPIRWDAPESVRFNRRKRGDEMLIMRNIIEIRAG